ncbi:hypothetical protein HDV05_008470 [Chytridiales sp. JEL 0842]|nr:hypothetical protein HDV05_008470 [Chytridiales sp. JEL 0842]
MLAQDSGSDDGSDSNSDQMDTTTVSQEPTAATTEGDDKMSENERMLAQLAGIERRIVHLMEVAAEAIEALAYEGADIEGAKEEFTNHHAEYMKLLNEIQIGLRFIFRYLAKSGMLLSTSSGGGSGGISHASGLVPLPYQATAEGMEKDFELIASASLDYRKRFDIMDPKAPPPPPPADNQATAEGEKADYTDLDPEGGFNIDFGGYDDSYAGGSAQDQQDRQQLVPNGYGQGETTSADPSVVGYQQQQSYQGYEYNSGGYEYSSYGYQNQSYATDANGYTTTQEYSAESGEAVNGYSYDNSGYAQQQGAGDYGIANGYSGEDGQSYANGGYSIEGGNAAYDQNGYATEGTVSPSMKGARSTDYSTAETMADGTVTTTSISEQQTASFAWGSNESGGYVTETTSATFEVRQETNGYGKPMEDDPEGGGGNWKEEGAGGGNNNGWSSYNSSDASANAKPPLHPSTMPDSSPKSPLPPPPPMSGFQQKSPKTNAAATLLLPPPPTSANVDATTTRNSQNATSPLLVPPPPTTAYNHVKSPKSKAVSPVSPSPATNNSSSIVMPPPPMNLPSPQYKPVSVPPPPTNYGTTLLPPTSNKEAEPQPNNNSYATLSPPALRSIQPAVHQDDHVEQQKSMVSIGYSASGSTQPEGASSTAQAESQLSASYTWTLPNVNNVTDEKMVSLPFGPSEWRWQIVVYPRGAGDALGTHMSGFLRPLRSLEEVSAGDDWFRPVKRFSIKVHRGGVVKAPSKAVVGPNGVEEPPVEGEEDDSILLEEISLPNFTGFSARVPGWGFSTLLPLDLLPEAMNPTDGSVVLTATVESDVSHPWTIHQFPWTVPGFSRWCAQPTEELYSPTFGPQHQRWCLKLSAQGSFLAGHLQPVLTDEEVALGDGWSRSISSFTLKIRQANTGVNVGSHMVTKTLTGGFTFNSTNLQTGWPNLLDLPGVGDAIFQDGSIVVDAELIWDPTAIEKERRGLVGWAASKSNELKNQVEQYRREVEALKRQLKSSDAERARVQAESNEVISSLKGKLAKDREKIEVLQAEVEVGRSAQAELGKIIGKMKDAKARVAEARAKMDEEHLPANGVAPDEASQEARDAEFFATKAKLFAMESELWSSKEELRIRTLELWSSKEELRVKAESTTTPNPPSAHVPRRMSMSSHSNPLSPEQNSELDLIPLSVAIENMKTELNSAKIALADISSRPVPPADPKPSYEAEKAAMRADLAMIHAELEVARASLVDAAINENPDVLYNPGGAQLLDSVVPGLRQDVISIIEQLEHAKNQVRFDLFFLDTNSNGYVAQQETLSVVADGQVPLDVTTSMKNSSSQFMHPPPQDNTWGGQSQYSANPLVAPPPMDNMNYYQQTSAAPAAQNEIETQRLLELEKAKTQAAHAEVEALKLQVATLSSVAASVANSGAYMAPSKLSLPDVETMGARGSHSPEPWTPVAEDGTGPVSAAQLSKELAKLLQTQQSRKSSSLLGHIFSALFFSTALFITYSTLHVHCDSHPQTEICRALVPAYQTVSNHWHSAAETFVRDVVPASQVKLMETVEKGKVAFGKLEKRVKKQIQNAEKEWALKAEREEKERIQREAIQKAKEEIQRLENEAKLKREAEDRERRDIKQREEAMAAEQRRKLFEERQALERERSAQQAEHERRLAELQSQKQLAEAEMARAQTQKQETEANLARVKEEQARLQQEQQRLQQQRESQINHQPPVEPNIPPVSASVISSEKASISSPQSVSAQITSSSTTASPIPSPSSVVQAEEPGFVKLPVPVFDAGVANSTNKEAAADGPKPPQPSASVSPTSSPEPAAAIPEKHEIPTPPLTKPEAVVNPEGATIAQNVETVVAEPEVPSTTPPVAMGATPSSVSSDTMATPLSVPPSTKREVEVPPPSIPVETSSIHVPPVVTPTGFSASVTVISSATPADPAETTVPVVKVDPAATTVSVAKVEQVDATATLASTTATVVSSVSVSSLARSVTQETSVPPLSPVSVATTIAVTQTSIASSIISETVIPPVTAQPTALSPTSVALPLTPLFTSPASIAARPSTSSSVAPAVSVTSSQPSPTLSQDDTYIDEATMDDAAPNPYLDTLADEPPVVPVDENEPGQEAVGGEELPNGVGEVEGGTVEGGLDYFDDVEGVEVGERGEGGTGEEEEEGERVEGDDARVGGVNPEVYGDL